MRALTLLRPHSYPNIIPLLDVFKCENSPPMVFPAYPSALFGVHEELKERAVVRSVMNQLLCGLRDMKRHGIIHMDINPYNIMWDGQKAVIIDFGLAQFMEDKYMKNCGTDGMTMW